jgi:predicted PurR-regulated permease PerM
MHSLPSTYLARVAAATAIVALAWLAWRLLDLVVLVGGAVMVAAVLDTLADPLQRRLGWRRTPTLAAVILALVGTLALLAALLGDRVLEQFARLRAGMPAALEAVARWLDSHPLGLTLMEVWDSAKTGEQVWAQVAALATGTLGAISGSLLVLAVGIYLAADPGLYRRGLLRLLPVERRPVVDEAMRAAGHALARWLLGQTMSMLSIGAMTAIGLAALGMPLALTLGLIAGLLAFVPFFGAVSSGLLIVLLSFAQGPHAALQAALLCLAIQQIEEFVLLPFIQRWAVSLPPALGLLGTVVFTLLFGLPGALVATPLLLVVLVLVQRLWVQRVADRPPAERGVEPRGAE